MGLGQSQEKNCKKKKIFFNVFGLTPSDAQSSGYSWLSTRELLLAVLAGQYGMPGIKRKSALCQASAPPTAGRDV